MARDTIDLPARTRGVHAPRFSIAQNLAKALDVPVEFFYSPDDQTAELLLQWHKLSNTKRSQLLKALEEMLWASRPR